MGQVTGVSIPAITEWQKEMQRRFEEAGQRIADTIQGGFAQTLGDAIYNAFSAAFSGEGIGGFIKAFGKTILAGVGQMFTQLGMIYLEYGVLMQSLSALLPNPFTAGPAGIAIGAALIAMGAALGAVAQGGGGRGTATGGAFRERASATQDITRIKFVDSRTGNPVNGLQTRPAVNNYFFGPNDPTVQRQFTELMEKANRRAA